MGQVISSASKRTRPPSPQPGAAKGTQEETFRSHDFPSRDRTDKFLLSLFLPSRLRRRLLRSPGLGIAWPNTRFFSDRRVHSKAPWSGFRLALLRLPRPVFLSIPTQPSGWDPCPGPRRLSGQPPAPGGSFSSAPRP